MKASTKWLIALLLIWVLVRVIAQQVPPATVYVTASDTLVLHSRSNWERDTFGNTHSGSPLLTNILDGNGDILAGQTVTDGAVNIPGGTTVVTSSVTAFQVVTTGNTATTTTISNVPTAQCQYITTGMAVDDAPGSVNNDIPANDYVASNCTSNSFTIHTAATGTHTSTALALTPGIVMSANATGTAVEEALTFNHNSITESVACDIVPPNTSKPTAVTPWTLTPATSAPTSDSTAASAALTEGWLRNCVISVTAGSPLDGTTWVQLDLVRGGTVQSALTRGNVTASQTVVYPPTNAQTSLAQTCHNRVDAFPEPAVGVAWQYSPVAGETTEMLEGSVLYQASTTLQDRVVSLIFTPREGVSPVFVTVGGPNGGLYFPTGMRTNLIFAEDPLPSFPNLGTLLAVTTIVPRIRIEGGGQGKFSLTGEGFTAGQISTMPSGDQITEFQGLFRPCLANY